MDCVNKKIPNRSKEEWYQDNRERLIEKQMIWNNANKDKLREYQKTFKTKHNLSKGIYVDLTEVEVPDEEHIKLHIDEIYDCDEIIDKDVLIELIDKNINSKLK